MEELVATYGYPLIFGLTFLEGETVVAIAGFAAHRGWLSAEGVFIAAFLGSFAGDQLYFHLGRHYGARILDYRPQWRPAADRALRFLARWNIWFILSFRFFYGLRTVSPFVIGMSTVDTRLFVVLNALAAALWAACFTALGYVFGDAVELALGNIKRIERDIFFALIAVGIVIYVVHLIRRARAPRA